MSSKAKDRTLIEWFSEIKKGAIKLPRFQRFEAWDKNRISSLLRTVVHDLPLGITLVLEVDDERRDWVDEEILRQRLHSHIIPIEELGTESYNQKNHEVRATKIRDDFNLFLSERAKLIYSASTLLTQGQHIDYAKVVLTRSSLFPKEISQ